MLALIAQTLLAAEPVKQVAPVGSTSGQMLTVIGALLLVIAAIYASVWGIKRLGNFTQPGDSQLKVLSGLMVGPKERVVLIECAGEKLLLGVGTGQVNLLHRLTDAQIKVNPNSVEQPFGKLLQEADNEA